jgi:hypothetical protein
MPDKFQAGCFVNLSKKLQLNHKVIPVCCGYEKGSNFNIDINYTCNLLDEILINKKIRKGI